MDRNRIYTSKKEPLELLSLSGNIARKNGEVYVHCHITISSGLDDAGPMVDIYSRAVWSSPSVKSSSPS